MQQGDSVEMAKPAKSAPQLYMAGPDRFAPPFSGAMATDHQAAAALRGGQLRLMPDTETSTSEEPGAGKRPAGICAGAAG